jgi:hypothetical protein
MGNEADHKVRRVAIEPKCPAPLDSIGQDEGAVPIFRDSQVLRHFTARFEPDEDRQKTIGEIASGVG